MRLRAAVVGRVLLPLGEAPDRACVDIVDIIYILYITARSAEVEPPRTWLKVR